MEKEHCVKEQQLISKNYMKRVTVILVIIGCEILFFHNILFNDQLIGYRIDGRLVTFLTEHWFQVFQGREIWSELPCFYPVENVLAYSDMMLLFAFPFSLLRAAGMNMYTSLKITAVFFHVIGSGTLYYFMRKYVKVPTLPALLTVICFSFSNGYNFISGNIQMFALSLVPILLIAFGYYIKNFEKKTRHVAAVLGMIWLALLFYTAFYVGYFVCLFAGIMLVVCLLVAFLLRKQVWVAHEFKNVINHWKEYICYLFLFIALMLPFIYLYLPALKDFGGRSWDELLVMFPTWKNICMLNEKSDALAGFNPRVYNHKTGFPITDLVIYGLVGVWLCCSLIRKIRKQGWEKREYILASSTLALLLSFLLILQFRGFTLWYFVYAFVPGASAIRAVLRWLNFISLPMGIFLGAAITYLGNMNKTNGKRNGFRFCTYGLVLVILVGNYSPIGIGTGWKASEEILFEESVVQPPQECEVMYIVDRENITELGDQELQMDAWAIALKYNLKTVNGYSGQFPKEWELSDVRAADIDQRVKGWLEKNSLSVQGVYAYDIGRNVWEKLE